MTRRAGAVLGVLLVARLAAAQFIQPGDKLVAGDAVGAARQGTSVAISADGNTVIVGGPEDNSQAGAAWVYVRSAGVWSQQGAKLVGTGAVGPAGQGYSVAISADGGTAIIGGPHDNSNAGAAWTFTRSAGVWTQQGTKLVGSGAVGSFGALQGSSVAISADGNTVIVGGPGDNAKITAAPSAASDPGGAMWVFTRGGGVWSQQGAKLVATDGVGDSVLGDSVAISADGNTAIAGGPADDYYAGAAWVFTRTGGVWSQQGGKLVGTGGSSGIRGSGQGSSVAISADGNAAIVGGPGDEGAAGAAWVYSRSAGAWSQQGGKLVGAGADGGAWQGASVAISADGKTALVGGPTDRTGMYPDCAVSYGAVWAFTRSGGAWSQQGGKLVAGDGSAPAFGASVAISPDGKSAIVGAPHYGPVCAPSGAAWVLTASAFSVWVPVASHNPGKNESQWRSDLGLLNTGGATANAQITFLGSSPPASNTTYVPAGTQVIVNDIVGQLGGSGSGALSILSDQPLKVTARTYNQVVSTASCYADGTQGQDYPAVVPSNGLAAGQSAYLAALVENASYRSNIGAVNTGTADATVLVELFDGAGGKLTDYLVSLAAGQWLQETQPFHYKALQTAMDRGYAKVTVQSGSGVFAFASVIDNVTNDPTTVAMQR